MKQVLWILLAFVLLCACEEKHFMTDPGYRKMVEQDFQKKKKVLEGNPGNLFAVFDSPMSVEEREALTFLYAYSPLIDLSFSGGDFLLKNVRWAFQAREAMPWGKDIPEDINHLITFNLFTTITNANFDIESIKKRIYSVILYFP